MIASKDARAAFGEIMDAGLALGGTITGEHGVGVLKREWLEREAGQVSMGVHRAVKAALDPLGILNPGKAVPTLRRCTEFGGLRVQAGRLPRADIPRF